MSTAFRGFLVACVLLLVAAVMPPAIQNVVIASAAADTYADNVFRRGEPRAGGKPWLHEDRNIHYRGGMQQGGHFGQQSQGFRTTSQSGRIVHWRRFVGVRRVAGAPMAQQRPRARCGGGCVTARPTCGTRCKPKCGTCNTAAASRQTNTAKVSNIKSVIKGDNNTVNQTVNVNQINVNGVAARAPTLSGRAVGPVLRGTARGSAMMAGMQLSVTTVTCTMSNGTAGVVAKVLATGEGRCVQKR